MEPEFTPIAPIAPRPGFIKATLIHLAGADPKVFPYLPPHEASDFAKLGASVLVPTLLALTAGSFTVWESSPEWGWQFAIAAGCLWATVILVIDVAVMSQLVKPCKIPPERMAGPARAFAPQPAELKDEVEESRWFQNKLIAALRIFIAVVLGLFMSHSLILSFFHKRIDQHLKLKRVIDKTGLAAITDKVQGIEKNLVAAERARLAVDDATFRRLYNDYLQQRVASPGGQTSQGTPAVQTPAPGQASGASTSGQATGAPANGQPTGASANEAGDLASSDNLLSQYQREKDALLSGQKQAVDDLTFKLKTARDELVIWRGDLKEAQAMQQAEARGTPFKPDFKTSDFRFAFGESTSGKTGEGERAKKIKATLPGFVQQVKDREAHVIDLQNQLNSLLPAHAAQQHDIQAKIDTRKAELLEGLRVASVAEDKERRLRADTDRLEVQKLRDSLQTEIGKLQGELDIAKANERDSLQPFEGASDFLERTAALVELIFDPMKSSAPGQKASPYAKAVFTAVIVITLLSFILIDLAPLTMKMLRSQSAYDVYLALMRRRRFSFPTGASDASRGRRPVRETPEPEFAPPPPRRAAPPPPAYTRAPSQEN